MADRHLPMFIQNHQVGIEGGIWTGDTSLHFFIKKHTAVTVGIKTDDKW